MNLVTSLHDLSCLFLLSKRFKKILVLFLGCCFFFFVRLPKKKKKKAFKGTGGWGGGADFFFPPCTIDFVVCHALILLHVIRSGSFLQSFSVGGIHHSGFIITASFELLSCRAKRRRRRGGGGGTLSLLAQTSLFIID